MFAVKRREKYCGLPRQPNIPGDGSGQAFFEGCSGCKTKLFFCPGSVKTPPGLAIWFRYIPANFTVKSGQFHNQLYQVFNLDFKAGADIDWFRLIIFFG